MPDGNDPVPGGSLRSRLAARREELANMRILASTSLADLTEMMFAHALDGGRVQLPVLEREFDEKIQNTPITYKQHQYYVYASR